MRSALTRLAAFLAVLTLLSSPLLAAGGRAPRAQAGEGLFTALWRLAGELVKLGSGMDPNGLAAAACSDLGSIMDPNGCPGAQTAGSDSDLGSMMDPDGRN